MMDYRIEYEISAILILVILMVYFLVKPRRFSKQLNLFIFYCAAVFFININSQDRSYSHSENQKNMAKVDNNNYSTLDEAADYSMIDNEDIYAYVSDN